MIRKRIVNPPLSDSTADTSDALDSDSMIVSDDVLRLNNITIPVPNMNAPVIQVQPVVQPVLSVPAKNILNNTNVKNLKNFRVIRRNVKQQLLKQEFITQVSSVLDLFNKTDNEYEHEIVAFCAQVAEDFFITHSGMGQIKQESVVEVCRKYFNEDDKLVKTIIALVLPSVTKSNFFRRNKQRITGFFLWAFERFCSV